VIDIGGGVGAIQHELLDAGAAATLAVDVSEAYLAAARAEGERRGRLESMNFVAADFVTAADGLPPADVVTLDRVICCYPDMERLVERSVVHANRLYGLVYPRSGVAPRVLARLANTFMALRRCDFRVFIHPTADVDRAVRAHGLELAYRSATPFWQVFLYRRR
jgi:predicted TPR repeat methyltransferase